MKNLFYIYLTGLVIVFLLFRFEYINNETAFTVLFLYTFLNIFFIRQFIINASLKNELAQLKKEKNDIAFKMQIQEKMLFLQSRQASVGELIGNVSHQWKEPLGGLGAILSNLHAILLIRGEVSKDKLSDSIDKGYKIIHHLSDTLSVFQRFFKSQRSDKTDFNVYEEISNISLMVGYSMKAEQISLKFDCDKDISFHGDRSEFANVILNIILNAKDILIERKVQDPFIELKVFKEGESIVITIKDNGGGIYQEPIEKIFEYSVSSKEDSTGIGLFIVKNIIENRLRGTIKVENNDKGALFTITLPITYGIINHNQMISYDVEETAYDRIARLEKELVKQSEVEKTLGQWETIFTQTHWGVAVHKGSGNTFEMVNPAFYKMYGFTPNELKNMVFSELFAPEFRDILLSKQEEAFEKSFVSFEALHIKKDGSRFPVNIDLTVIKNEYDEILYHISNVRDITELKESQRELLLKKFAINKIHESVFLIDKNSKFHYVNEGACKALGYTSEELLNLTVGDIDPDWPSERWSEYWEVLKQETTMTMQLRHKRKDGTIFPVEVVANYIEYEDESYNMALARDISERLEAEKRKDDEKTRLFFERQLVGMAITSPTKGWLNVNDKLCEVLGYTFEELKNMTWAEMTHPDDLEKDVLQFDRLLSGEIEDYTLEKRFIRKDGNIVYTNLAVSCVRNDDGSANYVLALIEDITERKQAIDALHRSEELYRNSSNLLNSVMESSAEVTIFTLDKEYKYLTFNELHKNFYKNKYGIDVALGKNFVELVPDKDFAKGAKNSWDRALSGESFSIITEEETFKDGYPVIEYWNNYISPIFDDAKDIIGLTVFSINITKLREIEKKLESLNATLEQKVKERTLELQQSLDFNKGIINAIPDLMFEVDKKGTYLNIWAKDEKLLAAQKEILLGNKISDVLAEDATMVVMEAIQEADRNGLSFGKIFKIDLPNGVYWFELSASKKADGNFIFISRDVTERKVAQIKIEEEREKFSSIFQLSPSGIAISSLERMVYVDVNESLLGYSGYTREEMIGRGTLELNIFYNPSERLELLQRLEKDGEVSDFEYSYRTKNGYIGNAMMYGKIITLNGEKCLLSHSYDITERKKIEILQKERLELEERFSKIAVAAPGVNYIFEKTVDGIFRFTYLAPTFEELSGLSQEIVLNDFSKSLEIILPQDREKVMQCILSSAENLTILHMEFRIMHQQKGILWVESQSKPEKLPDGTIVWYGFLYYITNRKNDEQKLGLLNKAIDNASDAVYIVKDDHSIYYVSEGACRMLGYTKEEFFTMKIEDIDPLMSTKEITVARNEVKKQQNLILQTKHRKKNGEIIDVEITGTEFNYDDFSLRLAIVKDISERKKYEEEILQLNKTLEHKVAERTTELQKALEFNSSIIQAIPDVLFEISKDGVYLNIWVKDENLLAQKKEILLGKNIKDIFPPIALDVYLQTMKEVDKYGSSLGNSYKLDLKDGEHWFELHTTKKEPEGTYLAIARDITERKKAQNELIELNITLEEKVKERTLDLQCSLELTNEIINTLPDLLFEMDKEGNYLNIWAQNKELLARQKEILLGNNIYNVLSKEASDTIIEAFNESDIGKPSIGKSIVIDLPDGKKKFGLSVSKKSDGNFLILSRDITPNS